jgi:hypothetical protein
VQSGCAGVPRTRESSYRSRQSTRLCDKYGFSGTARSRAFAPAAVEGTGETDSPAEEAGFELPVPLCVAGEGTPTSDAGVFEHLKGPVNQSNLRLTPRLRSREGEAKLQLSSRVEWAVGCARGGIIRARPRLNESLRRYIPLPFSIGESALQHS